MIRKRKKITYSRTSPKNDKRGCLCPDGKSYSTECCDGSLQAQGIGNITGRGFLLLESRAFLLQDDEISKIFL
jgi:hypothetical protein